MGVDLSAGMVEVASNRYPRATFVQVILDSKRFSSVDSGWDDVNQEKGGARGGFCALAATF